MATAGKPLSATPINARMARNADQCGSTALSIPSTAERNNAPTIIGLRPHASDSPPATSIETASRPVVNDSARLAAAALT
jgi:hypothetical protein